MSSPRPSLHGSVRCAWCGAHIADATWLPFGVHSDGICPSCRTQHFPPATADARPLSPSQPSSCRDSVASQPRTAGSPGRGSSLTEPPADDGTAWGPDGIRIENETPMLGCAWATCGMLAVLGAVAHAVGTPSWLALPWIVGWSIAWGWITVGVLRASR